MRPRSAGSSRISKRLLPLRAETAISTASPLNGTGALVAAVTFSVPTGAAAAVTEASCGWIVPVAWTPVSDESISVCPGTGAGGWSCAAPGVADVDEGPAEESAFTMSAVTLPASGLAATAGGCARLLCAGSAGVAVADGSAVPELGSEAPAAAAFGGAASGALVNVVFGATDSVAATATAAVNAGSAAAATLAGVAGCLTGVAIAALAAAWTATFAVAVAAAVFAVTTVVALAAVAAVAAVAAATSELILISAVDAAGAAGAGELAAIAAAAIASGAVALPDAGGAAGTSVDAMMTGLATTTALGMVTDAAACGAAAAATAEESAAALLPDDGFSVDFTSPGFEAPDFAPGR